MACRQICGAVTLLLGLGFLITGILVPSIVYDVVDDAIRDGVFLDANDAEDVQDFTVPKDPITKTFCVWNYTNVAEASADANVKLAVEDVCYTFDLEDIKYNISFKEDGDRVEWISRPERSDRDNEVTRRLDSEELTVPNTRHFVGRQRNRGNIMAQYILTRGSSDEIATASQGLIDNEQAAAFATLFRVPATTQEFLEGNARGEAFFGLADYQDAGIDSAQRQALMAGFMNSIITGAFVQSPATVEGGAAEAFITVNARALIDVLSPSFTDDDSHFAVNSDRVNEQFTGKADVDDSLTYFRVFGDTVYTAWNEDIQIEKPRDFSQIEPFQQDDLPDSTNIWVEQTRRTIQFNRAESEVSFQDITLSRFTIAAEEYLSAANNPANAVYDMYRGDGMLYIGRTIKDEDGEFTVDPFWLTNPHMLRVDDPVADFIDGQSPDSEAHESYVDYEMRTGLAFRGARRIQLNVRVEAGSMPLNPSLIPAGTADMFLPLYWAEDYAAINEEDADSFKQIDLAIDIARPTVIAFGAILMLLSILCLRPRKEASPAKVSKY